MELRPESGDYIWALRNVSFEIKKGEAIGIIGHNGAGKTTLLKILSRITDPSEGYGEIRGKVGSLLDVGTGFHPELTGRENVYLNGAILGMKKAEIEGKFDQIVDFAEVAKFIDTQMKFYSDGMFVRLAFSVAAHLEPEILLVDEVLAVGDVAFQRKCLGKMGEVREGGRTVVFVSHNLAAILSLCDRACLLQNGKLIHDANAREVVEHYLQTVSAANAIPLGDRKDRFGDGSTRILSLQIGSEEHDQLIRSTSRLKITISYRSQRPIRHARFLIEITDPSDRGIFNFDSDDVGGLPDDLPSEGAVTCLTEPTNLTSGLCFVHVSAYRGRLPADCIKNAASFEVFPSDVFGTGKNPIRDNALCVIGHEWHLQQ